VERSIAFAYVPAEVAVPGTDAEVLIFGDWIPALVAAEPLFDPEGQRIRS
jgi:glycine cleavage system aminomethyltransferase T